ncbi:uncharacterized protein LOC126761287 [Bactrocera neohumeralis]|uniref:uncharacterized protein LOC126761287 n=1 Tax=Bactrocera neohumeralis TaxID=98809 RepID=UPI002165AA50|nr:uncharacterized protein LOC126761287 [Bactrocera neohumeralis]
MFKLISESCMSAIFLLLLFSDSPNYASAACNSCSVTTNLACVSKTEFSVCVNGLPTGTASGCPDGYICSTTAASICVSSTGTSIVGDCEECKTCDTSHTFACTGVRTYALCLGTDSISDLGGSCAPYHVCSIDYPYICGNETLGITPTCSTADGTDTTTTTETTTTTIATTTSGSVIVTDPVAYCQTLQQSGRFPVGNELSTTCKQYVYCFVNNSVWSGVLYYCPGDTYFDSTTRYCSPTIPARCSSSRRSLYLRGYEIVFDDGEIIE